MIPHQLNHSVGRSLTRSLERRGMRGDRGLARPRREGEEKREKRGERREKREDRIQTPRGRQMSPNEAARGPTRGRYGIERGWPLWWDLWRPCLGTSGGLLRCVFCLLSSLFCILSSLFSLLSSPCRRGLARPRSPLIPFSLASE